MRKLAATLLIIGLLVPGPAFAQTGSDKGAAYEQLNLFGEAFERIRQDAVDPVPDKRLIDTAVSGMLTSLDPHSTYLSESAYKALQSPQPSGTGSIGVVATIEHGELTVVSALDGSPAAKAGIEPGDAIFTINKEPTYEMSLTEAESKLRGPVGTDVALVLRRGTRQIVTLKIKRQQFILHTVSSRIDDGDVGYIRIAGFDDATPAALAGAVQGLQQKAGNKLVGYVIDLRNNPGGDFKAAVAAADAFIDKGDITVVKGREASSDKHIAATKGDIANGLPIVALVNGGTAREAELVAAALQDNHRAELLGTKTFGESAIESIIPLPGDNGAIRLTTARFLTPDGQAIQGKGIKPNLVVEPLKVEKLAEGERLREADLPGALKNPDVAAKKAGATTVASPHANVPPGTTPAPPAAKATSPSLPTTEMGGQRDEQLAQAIDVLRGLSIISARGTR